MNYKDNRKKIPHYISELINTNSSTCESCRGALFNPADLMASQKSALKKYGIVPNDCVPSLEGNRLVPHCPYADQKK